MNTKQPKTLWLAGGSMMTERFAYYILTFVIVFYMKSVYNFSDKQAFAMFAIFSSLSYLTPMIGGYLSDNFIGTERVLIIGLLIEATGYLLLTFKGSIVFFYLALSLVVIGTGLFKTTPTNILGKSYIGSEDLRIDAGFTYFYVLMNLGAFFSSILSGIFLKSLGYGECFLFGAVVSYCGAIGFILYRKKIIKKEYKSKLDQQKVKKLVWIIFSIAATLSIGVFIYILLHKILYIVFFFAMLLIFIIYYLIQALKLEGIDRKKFIFAIVLIMGGAVFTMMYMQYYSSILMYLKRSVNTRVFGITLSPVMIMGVNPIVIMILGPILAKVYKHLGTQNRDLKISTKYTLGLYITSISFLLLFLSTYFVTNGQNNIILPILAYVLYTIGELLVSALGFSVVVKLAPKKLSGFMMGVWFFAGLSFGSVLAGKEAELAAITKGTNLVDINLIYRHAFFSMLIIGLILSTIFFIVIKKCFKIEGI